MRVIFCGRLQDAAGRRVAEIDPPSDVRTTLGVRDWLSREDPALGEALRHPSVRIVVNDTLVPEERPVAEGDEIAFMPPVSGG